MRECITNIEQFPLFGDQYDAINKLIDTGEFDYINIEIYENSIDGLVQNAIKTSNVFVSNAFITQPIPDSFAPISSIFGTYIIKINYQPIQRKVTRTLHVAQKYIVRDYEEIINRMSYIDQIETKLFKREICVL